MQSGDVGGLLKHWRQRRRMSQAQLAEQAEVSTRHLSFLENGRSQPSRQMLLILGSALDLPLRERNTLLRAAGFTAAYRETDLDAPEMAQVRQAVDFLLTHAEPYGAAVIDRQWNLLRANRPLAALSQMLLGHAIGPGHNVMTTCFDPAGLRPHIRNWEVLAPALLDRLHRQAMAEADPRTEELLRTCLAYPDVPQGWRELALDQPPSLLVPVELAVGAWSVKLFTTITTLGTAEDVTLSELCIEHYFPADAQTAALLQQLQAGGLLESLAQ